MRFVNNNKTDFILILFFVSFRRNKTQFFPDLNKKRKKAEFIHVTILKIGADRLHDQEYPNADVHKQEK